MARIVKAELRLVDLKPMTQRTDAIQAFVSQETPILTLTDADGATGTGYTYTIGSGTEGLVTGVMMMPVPQSGILQSVDGEEQARGVTGITEVQITARLHDYIAAWPEGSSYLGFLNRFTL